MKSGFLFMIIGICWLSACRETPNVPREKVTSMQADTIAYQREEIIYARTHGTALTMDVFTPRGEKNGLGVIFFVSEGWYSGHEKIDPYFSLYIEPLLREGFTVFAVIHGSNPKFHIGEVTAQARCAVRFIRHQAKRFGIQAEQLGAIGDSAGGHLSLLLGMTDEPSEDPADPFNHVSARVQAVVAFYPPTDFLNWGEPGKVMLGDHPKVPLHGAFRFTEWDTLTLTFETVSNEERRREIARKLSPFYHAKASSAPSLIVVGDADSFIPPEQSKKLHQALLDAGATTELIVKPGGEHDGETIEAHFPDAIRWFKKHLSN